MITAQSRTFDLPGVKSLMESGEVAEDEARRSRRYLLTVASKPVINIYTICTQRGCYIYTQFERRLLCVCAYCLAEVIRRRTFA